MDEKINLIIRGASVMPKKTFAAALRLSHAVVPTVTCSSQPAFMTTTLNVHFVD